MEVNGGRLTPLDYAMINSHGDVGRFLVDKGGLCVSDIKALAAVSIQSRVRGFLARRRYSVMQASAKKKHISSHHPDLPHPHEHAIGSFHLQAAITLQAVLRGAVARKSHAHRRKCHIEKKELAAAKEKELARLKEEKAEKEAKKKEKDKRRISKDEDLATVPSVPSNTTVPTPVSAPVADPAPPEPPISRRILAARVARHTLARKEQRRVALVRDCIRVRRVV